MVSLKAKRTLLAPLVKIIINQGIEEEEGTITIGPALTSKIEIPEFEGRLDLDEFHDWLHTVKRVFDYKDILEDKKLNSVALRLRNYASL